MLLSPNAVSIAMAYAIPGYELRGIYLDERLVGFIMWGKVEHLPDFWISRLMIDRQHRRKGYAEGAMKSVMEELSMKPDFNQLFLSFEPENTVASKLYEKLGFEDTGKVDPDGELIYVWKPTLD